MKRDDLIRKLDNAGCILILHGGNHDWYRNPKTGISQPVHRHREIDGKHRGIGERPSVVDSMSIGLALQPMEYRTGPLDAKADAPTIPA